MPSTGAITGKDWTLGGWGRDASPLGAFWCTPDPQPCLPHSWRAANYSQFWGMTLEDGIRYRLGTFRPSPTVMNMNEMHVSWPPQMQGETEAH